MSHGTGEAATRRDGRGAPLSALAGGLVSFVTIFLPLAPVVGGAIAGYLRAGDARAGALTGSLAGLVTVLLLAGLASGVLALLPVPLDAGQFPDPLGLVLGAGGVLLAAYVLVLSTVGGVCGSFAASEVDIMGR
ncbi:DUF5518 domain-containing protein [Haloglomus halophilum]|uniref:DUF5518 domain-containing protein n=1 Tax=Haloglomus halophilum TaxID=2962672 RepID=UPI0020C9F413|nr:DUF5518 domain-containing protein [Haloglomus halophilum]